MDRSIAACEHYLQVVAQEMGELTQTMDLDGIVKAADMILQGEQEGARVHLSGIGKPSYIAGYMASLLSSTGTPAYYLHGTEAVHGSCGQLRPGDIVIFISNSGETMEMRATVTAVKNNGCRVIGVSGNPNSWLADVSDLHLHAPVGEEGGPLNRAPRMSILSEELVLQTLSVYLQAYRQITPQQYVRWHPGGKLGQLRKEEQ